MATNEKKDKSAKPSAKKSVKAKSTSAKQPAKRTAKKAAPVKQRSVAPFVLIIMVLVAVIIFILIKPSRFTDTAISKADKTRTETKIKDTPSTKDTQIEKDNDKPDKKEKVEDPEKTAIHETEHSVRIWFLRFNEKTEKVSLVSVKRKFKGDDRIEGALKKLLEGPTAQESKQDYLTALPQNLKLRGVKVQNKIAELDFTSALGEGANGTILMNRLDQIVYTATQFEDVNGVVIAINGKRQSMLGSDGLSIQGPLTRK